MAEIRVAKLDEEDIKSFRGLIAGEKRLAEGIDQFRSRQIAFWELLRRKYKLELNGGHYIKDKAIYRQVL